MIDVFLADKDDGVALAGNNPKVNPKIEVLGSTGLLVLCGDQLDIFSRVDSYGPSRVVSYLLKASEVVDGCWDVVVNLGESYRKESYIYAFSSKHLALAFAKEFGCGIFKKHNGFDLDIDIGGDRQSVKSPSKVSGVVWGFFKDVWLGVKVSLLFFCLSFAGYAGYMIASDYF